MPFLFVGLIIGLMILANKPSAAKGAGAGALRRRTSAPIYDIGEEVMLPRYGDWGVIEEARPMGDTWVYGVSISHGQRVRVRECDVCEG